MKCGFICLHELLLLFCYCYCRPGHHEVHTFFSSSPSCYCSLRFCNSGTEFHFRLASWNRNLVCGSNAKTRNMQGLQQEQPGWFDALLEKLASLNSKFLSDRQGLVSTSRQHNQRDPVVLMKRPIQPQLQPPQPRPLQQLQPQQLQKHQHVHAVLKEQLVLWAVKNLR